MNLMQNSMPASASIFFTRKLSKCSSHPEALLLNQHRVWQWLHFPSDSTTVDMIFAALCTAANIKQRHLIRGTGWATTANGRESRDQAAKTHQQLAPISNAEIECGTATATQFPTGEETNKSEGEHCFLEHFLYFNVQDSVPLHTLYET